MKPMKLPPDLEFYEDTRLLIYRPHGLLNESAFMKSVITKSLRCELVECRRSDGTAECRRITEACIVNQHEENVRRIPEFLLAE
jgi:hypothetical protein